MKIDITGNQLEIFALVRRCERVVGGGYSYSCSSCVFDDICGGKDRVGIESIARFVIAEEADNG